MNDLREARAFARRGGAVSRAARSARLPIPTASKSPGGDCNASSQARSGLRSCAAVRRSSAASASTSSADSGDAPNARARSRDAPVGKRSNRVEQCARFGGAARVTAQFANGCPLRSGGKQSVGEIVTSPLLLQCVLGELRERQNSRRIPQRASRIALRVAPGGANGRLPLRTRHDERRARFQAFENRGR